ncbi:MAG: hypothetical protein L0241_05005, partial [Planctomycetia bacterium]|nr:hypothetical protein [Planctomycetia bacterium]
GMFSKLFGSKVSLPFFADTVQDIMQRTTHVARLKGLRAMWKPAEKGGIGMTDEWFKELLTESRVLTPGAQLTAKTGKGLAKAMKEIPGTQQLNPDQVNQLLSHMQNLKYTTFEPSTGLFGSIAQRAGLYLAPIVSVLEKQGGVHGARLAQGINNTLRGTYTNYGRVLQDYIKVIEDLKLDNAAATSIREASTLIAEAGGPAARMADVLAKAQAHGQVSKEVMDVLTDPAKFSLASRLAEKTRSVFDLYGNILSGFRDAGGRPFMVQFDDGVRPFADAIVPNYVAHMFKWDGLKPGTKQFDAFLTNFMKQNNITSKAIARDVFETMVRKTPKHFGNVEHARMFNLGGYILDPLEYMPKWLYNTEYRLNFAKNFGLGGSLRRSNSASQLVQAIKAGTRAGENVIDGKWLDDVEAILLDRHPRNYGVSELVRKITGFQVLTKMGLGSTVANLSQNVNTATTLGLRNFMRGVANTFTEEGDKFAALAYNRATKDALNEMITGSKQHGFAGKFLDAIGFNYIEKWNRFFAANSGVAALRNWSAQLQGLQPGTTAYNRVAGRLQRMLGVTEPELVRLASGQAPSGAMLDRAALLASEATQHTTNWSQMPKLWQIPEARIALQYKNFAYNQTRFTFQHIIGPAVEYIQTRGRGGDIAPLMRAIPLFTTAGHAVNHLRELIRMPMRGALTG